MKLYRNENKISKIAKSWFYFFFFEIFANNTKYSQISYHYSSISVGDIKNIENI